MQKMKDEILKVRMYTFSDYFSILTSTKKWEGSILFSKLCLLLKYINVLWQKLALDNSLELFPNNIEIDRIWKNKIAELNQYLDLKILPIWQNQFHPIEPMPIISVQLDILNNTKGTFIRDIRFLGYNSDFY